MAWLKNNYQFEFTDTLTTSWTSVRISNEKENNAVATFTNQYITVRSEDNSIVERMKGSAAAWTLTLTMRWLDQSDTDTQDAWLKRERREGSKAFVTYVASQHVDAKGENIFSWTQTFENITVTNNSTLTNATVSGKYKWPSVDDVAERNSMYPTPVDWNMVQVETIWLQYYKTSAGGWVTLDEWTPTPDATEVVKGKARIATTAEVTAGTDDNTIVTPLKANSLKTPEALFEKDQYIAWETILVNDSLFVEKWPTYAEATLTQNIGDVTANTRVVLYDFSSGISSNKIKLSLRKFVSPTADLSVRLETISWWLPTWTLIDPDATAIINSSNLTTSLADTAIILWSRTTTWHWVTLNSNETTQFAYKWLKFNPNGNIHIVTVEKISWSTATKAYIYDSNYTLLTSASFVWDIATLNTDWLLAWEDYYIVAGSDWSSYTSVKQTWSTSYPYTNTKLNYTWWFNKSVDASDVSNNNTSWNGSAFNTWWFVTFSVTNSCKLASFNSTSHTITWNCELRDNSWTLIETAVWNNFSGNTVLVKWTNYRIQYTKASSWPNLSTTLALTAWKNITYVSDSNWANKYLGNYTINTVWYYDETSDINNIVNIVSVDEIPAIPKWQKYAIVMNAVWDVVNGTNYYWVGYAALDTTTRQARTFNGTVWSSEQATRFYYVSSISSISTLLSKTDADYTYKLPTNYPRIATNSYTAGQEVTSVYYGLAEYPWLVANTAYYVANTAGAISAVAGTNPYVLGKTDGNNILKIDWKVLNKSITVWASPFSYTNTTGWPIQVSITGGTVNPIVINWVTTATATNHINTLPSWATMTVTYTVLPTIVYSDL